MKSSLIRIGVIYLSMLLLLGGCQSAKKASIPVTGNNNPSAPAQVKTARNNTVDYLISSARLESTPPREAWQLDTGQQKEGEYHFSNGDWVMIVWSADARQNERIILRNKAKDIIWCGYVQSNGHVVDTSYLP